MNKFIRQSLEEGEEIVYNGRLHWSAIFSYLAWTVVLVIGAAVFGFLGYHYSQNAWYYTGGVALVIAIIVYLIGRVVRTRSEFVVTNTRFIQKDGIFDIKMTEIPLFKVETVNFTQSFGQRILGTGCIELVGSGGTNHNIHCIENPMEVRKKIVSTINKQGKKQEEE